MNPSNGAQVANDQAANPAGTEKAHKTLKFGRTKPISLHIAETPLKEREKPPVQPKERITPIDSSTAFANEIPRESDIRISLRAPRFEKHEKHEKPKVEVLEGANLALITHNINRGGSESPVATSCHWLKKFKNLFPETAIAAVLSETGVQNQKQADELDAYAKSIGMIAKHVFVDGSMSNLILKARLSSKGSPNNEASYQPKRGGVSFYWSACLGDAKQTFVDETKHFIVIDVENQISNKKYRFIALYNNQPRSPSNHPYDSESGEQILRRLMQIYGKKRMILLGDFNLQTDNETLQDISARRRLADAIAEKNLDPVITYRKGAHATTPDHILIPKHTLENNLLFAAGLLPSAMIVDDDDQIDAPEAHKFDPKSDHLPIYATVQIDLIGIEHVATHLDEETAVMKPNQPKDEAQQDAFQAQLAAAISSSLILSNVLLDEPQMIAIEKLTHAEQKEAASDHAAKSCYSSDELCDEFTKVYNQCLVDVCGIKRRAPKRAEKFYNNPLFFYLKIIKERAFTLATQLGLYNVGQTPDFPTRAVYRLQAAMEKYVEIDENSNWKISLSSKHDTCARGPPTAKLIMEMKSIKNLAGSLAKRFARQYKAERMKRVIEMSVKSGDLPRMWSSIKNATKAETTAPKPEFILAENENGVVEKIYEKSEAVKIVAKAWDSVTTPTVKAEKMRLPEDDDDREAFIDEQAPFLRPDGKPRKVHTVNPTRKYVSLDELHKATEGLAKNKAPGTDNFRSNELKRAPYPTTSVIWSIINTAIHSGKLPEQWAIGRVVLLYKKGGAENPLNYRPIALLQLVSKLYTGVLNTRLVDSLEASKSINPIQAGFLRGRGTQEQVAHHISILDFAKRMKKELHMAYIDLKKAFDTVPHEGIRHGLERYNVEPDLIEQIMGCYKNMKSMYSSPWGETDTVNIHMGVRQGDPLSPTLFIVFLNLFLDWAEKTSTKFNADVPCFLLAYADDLVFYAPDGKSLQEALGRFEKFLDFYGFAVGHDKCAYQCTNTPEGSLNTSPVIQNAALPVLAPSETYCYLGYDISMNLKWSVARDNTFVKCKRLLGALDRAYYLDATTKAIAINAAVWPIALYRCLVPFSRTKLESLQQKAQAVLRRALRATNSFPSNLIAQETSLGGLNLQHLPLEMESRRLSTIASILNKDCPTGTEAIGNSLNHAIGVDLHINHKSANKRLTDGPYEFSPQFSLSRETDMYTTTARKSFFYRAIKDAVKSIEAYSGIKLHLSWAGAYRPTIRNALTEEEFQSEGIKPIRIAVTKVATPKPAVLDLRHLLHQPLDPRSWDGEFPDSYRFVHPGLTMNNPMDTEEVLRTFGQRVDQGTPFCKTYEAMEYGRCGYNARAILALRELIADTSGAINPKIAGNYLGTPVAHSGNPETLGFAPTRRPLYAKNTKFIWANATTNRKGAFFGIFSWKSQNDDHVCAVGAPKRAASTYGEQSYTHALLQAIEHILSRNKGVHTTIVVPCQKTVEILNSRSWLFGADLQKQKYSATIRRIGHLAQNSEFEMIYSPASRSNLSETWIEETGKLFSNRLGPNAATIMFEGTVLAMDQARLGSEKPGQVEFLENNVSPKQYMQQDPFRIHFKADLDPNSQFHGNLGKKLRKARKKLLAVEINPWKDDPLVLEKESNAVFTNKTATQETKTFASKSRAGALYTGEAMHKRVKNSKPPTAPTPPVVPDEWTLVQNKRKPRKAAPAATEGFKYGKPPKKKNPKPKKSKDNNLTVKERAELRENNRKFLAARQRFEKSQRFRALYDTQFCHACETPDGPKAIETAQHILSECPATEEIVAASADPIILQRLDALQAKLCEDKPDMACPPMVPFWADKPMLDGLHHDLHYWMRLGAVPKPFNDYNRDLGFDPDACRTLATTLSKLLIERSQHAYKVHRALTLERFRARPPPLPGEHISSGVPDPPQPSAAAASAAPLENQTN